AAAAGHAWSGRAAGVLVDRRSLIRAVDRRAENWAAEPISADARLRSILPAIVQPRRRCRAASVHVHAFARARDRGMLPPRGHETRRGHAAPWGRDRVARGQRCRTQREYRPDTVASGVGPCSGEPAARTRLRRCRAARAADELEPSADRLV